MVFTGVVLKASWCWYYFYTRAIQLMNELQVITRLRLSCGLYVLVIFCIVLFKWLWPQRLMSPSSQQPLHNDKKETIRSICFRKSVVRFQKAKFTFGQNALNLPVLNEGDRNVCFFWLIPIHLYRYSLKTRPMQMQNLMQLKRNNLITWWLYISFTTNVNFNTLCRKINFVHKHNKERDGRIS